MKTFGGFEDKGIKNENKKDGNKKENENLKFKSKLNFSKSIALKFALLVFTVAIAALYAGSFVLHLPAVVNENGELVLVNATAVPGSGQVFIKDSVLRNETYESVLNAIKCAAKLSNINYSKYNFILSIEPAGTYGGPSGGAGFGLAFLEALKNESFNSNFTISGGLDENCNILPVGGIFEKANASKSFSFIILPKDPEYSPFYFIISKALNVKIAEASTLKEAYEYASGKLAVPTQNFQFFAPLNATKVFEPTQFYALKSFMANLAASSFSKLNFSNGLREEMDQDLAIMDKGYSYAGANNLFQRLIYTEAINHLNSSFNIDTLYSFTKSVNEYCKKQNIPSITTSNFEFVLFGMQRRTWGIVRTNQILSDLDKIKKSMNASNGNSSTDYFDLIYYLINAQTAKLWCMSANYSFGLNSQASPSIFYEINQSKLKQHLIGKNATFFDPFYAKAFNYSSSTGAYADALLEVAFGEDSNCTLAGADNVTSAIAKEYVRAGMLYNSTSMMCTGVRIDKAISLIKQSLVPHAVAPTTGENIKIIKPIDKGLMLFIVESTLIVLFTCIVHYFVTEDEVKILKGLQEMEIKIQKQSQNKKPEKKSKTR